MIPLLMARAQPLRWRPVGLLVPRSIEVECAEGTVASLEIGRSSSVYVGHLEKQVWRLDKNGPNFYRDSPEEASWPPVHGTFELGEAVTFAAGPRFQWKVTDFWKSREGFCDDGARRLMEFSGQDLWIHGGVDDEAVLPPLLFVGLIHSFFRKYEGAA